MAEISNGVKILLERMASHPEDFHGDALQWRFMFAEKFRDVLTEPEKGMIHEALRNLRRGEFDGLVLQAILRDEEEKIEVEEKAAEAMRAQNRQTKQSYQAAKQQASMGNSGRHINPLQNIFK